MSAFKESRFPAADLRARSAGFTPVGRGRYAESGGRTIVSDVFHQSLVTRINASSSNECNRASKLTHGDRNVESRDDH